MNRPFFSIVALLAALSLASLATTAEAAGQAGDYTPPRTPWGDPDVAGVFTSDDSINVPTQRNPDLGDRLFLTEEEYAERVSGTQSRAESFTEEFAPADVRIGTGPPGHWLELATEDSRQTSLVIDPPDGRIPEMTPEGRGRGALGSFNAVLPETPEDFTLYIRCITRGITGSIWPVIYGNGTRIVQAPGYVAISNEMVHEARIIPLDGRPHVSEDIRMYMGDSRGRWEGDTLVIETRNLTDKTGVQVNGGGNRHSESMVLTERITRTAPDRVYYEATFDDPATWTAPWTVGFPLVERDTYQIFEYACHEGNNAMRNMLSAARSDEAAGVTRESLSQGRGGFGRGGRGGGRGAPPQ